MSARVNALEQLNINERIWVIWNLSIFFLLFLIQCKQELNTVKAYTVFWHIQSFTLWETVIMQTVKTSFFVVSAFLNSFSFFLDGFSCQILIIFLDFFCKCINIIVCFNQILLYTVRKIFYKSQESGDNTKVR